MEKLKIIQDDFTINENFLSSVIYALDNDAEFLSMIGAMEMLPERIVKCFTSTESLLTAYNNCQSNSGCIIASVRSCENGGITLFRKLRQLNCCLPFILIIDEEMPLDVMDAIHLGVVDIIVKPIHQMKLVRKINDCLTKYKQKTLVESKRYELNKKLRALSRRETEIMDLLISGLKNKEIASRLSVSTRTVEVHRYNIMKKMNADNFASLIATYVLSKADDLYSTI